MIKKSSIILIALLMLLPTLSVAKKGKQAAVQDSDYDKLGDLCKPNDKCTFYRKDILPGNIPIELQAVSLGQFRGAVNQVFDFALADLKRVAALLNPDDPTSEVSKVNANAGEGYVEVAEEFVQLITLAKKSFLWTNGAFDISATPDIGTFDNIKIKGNKIYLKRRGMKIDFHSMIHGYMADLFIQAIYNSSIDDGLAIVGPASRSIGSSAVGHWRTEVSDADGNYARRGMTLDTTGIAAASVVRGENAPTRDPRWATPPFVPQCRSVTILSRNAAASEALAYGIYVLGPEKGMQLVNQLQNIKAVIVDNNGNFIKSPGV